jgi:6-phosphogluconolactonase
MTLDVRALSRRTVLAGSAAAVGLSVGDAFAAPSAGFAYVASYGRGIEAFHVGNGEWRPVQSTQRVTHPFFLCFDHGRRFLYAVDDTTHEITAFRIDRATGKLSFLNAQQVGGKSPMHVAVDPTNRFLLTADYESGLSVLPRRDDGGIAPASDVVQTKGALGPHRAEQTISHPHQVVFDPAGRFLVTPDKGCDAMRSYALDDSGKLTLKQTMVMRESSGPRHVAFHPSGKFAYIANELNATVTACGYDQASGALTPVQSLSTAPDSYVGTGTSSEIAVSADGRFVYAAHRGADCIGVFAVDAQSGRMTLRRYVESGGRTPRFFGFAPQDGLYVGNEDSGTITHFAVDAANGLLAHAKDVAALTAPRCVLFNPPI